MSEPHVARAPEVKSSPADGLQGLARNWVPDLISGFVVFLLALPLSIGIALASGAPASAGLLAAIVGGLAGSLLGGSYLTINGPAAGLIVIVLGAVQDLGHGDPAVGFRRMLAATVVAGVLQMALGALKLGSLGVGVPGSVIHGMLSAIGIIIIAKQLHVALGVVPNAKSSLGLIAEIPDSIVNMNPEVALIAVFAFLVIVSHKHFKGVWTRFVPSPLLVTVAGILLARLFDFDHEHLVVSHGVRFYSGPEQLLNLPSQIAQAVVFPDFSQALTLTSLRWTVSLALVAGIESLLTAAAVDRLDPYGRSSNLDRELLTKGLCNAACGLIGALPIIAEIVRSSANVRNGARTRWANFFHGAFILVFLLAFPDLLHRIPLAALAAILVSVGYALAHPTQFLHTAKVGKEHFAAFLATLVVTLAVDLLVGVAVGILVEVAFNLLRGADPRHLFRVDLREHRHDEMVRLELRSPLVFTNFLGLKRTLDRAGEMPIEVDLSESVVVDHTALDNLHRYTSETKHRRAVTVRFSKEHLPVSSHPLAARRLVSQRKGGAG